MANVQQQVEASKGPDVQKGKKDNHDFSIQIWPGGADPGGADGVHDLVRHRLLRDRPRCHLPRCQHQIQTPKVRNASVGCFQQLHTYLDPICINHRFCWRHWLLLSFANRQQRPSKEILCLNFLFELIWRVRLILTFWGAAELPLPNDSNSPNPEKKIKQANIKAFVPQTC